MYYSILYNTATFQQNAGHRYCLLKLIKDLNDMCCSCVILFPVLDGSGIFSATSSRFYCIHVGDNR